MLRRLLIGLVEGLVIGLALGVAAVRGLGLNATSSESALLLGAVAGCLVGLVAGRPVWARDAKTEALLKAAVGAVGGAGLSLAAGHWLLAPLDLSAFQLGVGPAGTLSVATLPLVATVLALFFELDDDGSSRAKARVGGAPEKQRFRSPKGSTAPAEQDELDQPKDDVESKLGKR